MVDFRNYKQEVILDGIKDALLKTRYLLLMQTATNEFVGWRVTRARHQFLNYSFTDDISGFSSLTPNEFKQHVSLSIQELTGVTNWLSTDVQRSTNNLLQVFYGIKPSYLNVSVEWGGSGQYQAQFPNPAVQPRSSYPWAFDASGFDSPYYIPSESSELYAMNGIDIEFTLYNTVNIPLTDPGLMFVVNNMLVEPVDQATFKAMIQGKVARRIASPGQIYASTAYSGVGYGNVQPVSVSDVINQNAATLTKAGYPEEGGQ